jgi:hypothetical protein
MSLTKRHLSFAFVITEFELHDEQMISPEEANEYTSQLSITIEELKED